MQLSSHVSLSLNSVVKFYTSLCCKSCIHSHLCTNCTVSLC